MKSHWRFLIVVVLLGSAGLLLQGRGTHEIIPDRVPLASFPHDFDGWTSRDIPMGKDVLDVLGPGDFLVRDYTKPHNGGFVNLFVAYFASQRAGDTIHSPKNCLPGAGWFPVESDRITINVPGHGPFPANRYLIAKGEDRELVLYWYWAHDRAVASEYAAKLYLVTDSIRMHRSDGSLIRISTPLSPHQSVESAQQTLIAFAANIVPLIHTYVPQ
jgi:EpsI family protein